MTSRAALCSARLAPAPAGRCPPRRPRASARASTTARTAASDAVGRGPPARAPRTAPPAPRPQAATSGSALRCRPSRYSDDQLAATGPATVRVWKNASETRTRPCTATAAPAGGSSASGSVVASASRHKHETDLGAHADRRPARAIASAAASRPQRYAHDCGRPARRDDPPPAGRSTAPVDRMAHKRALSPLAPRGGVPAASDTGVPPARDGHPELPRASDGEDRSAA